MIEIEVMKQLRSKNGLMSKEIRNRLHPINRYGYALSLTCVPGTEVTDFEGNFLNHKREVNLVEYATDVDILSPMAGIKDYDSVALSPLGALEMAKDSAYWFVAYNELGLLEESWEELKRRNIQVSTEQLNEDKCLYAIYVTYNLNAYERVVKSFVAYLYEVNTFVK